MITQGIYEHYKSTPKDRKHYQVLFLSHFEDTLEVMVHYIPMYFEENDSVYSDGITIWTRTLQNFEETVEYKGKQMPRFTRIDSTIQ